MPRKYNKKIYKSYDFKKMRGIRYKSKLADKSINTLVEKRIQEISRKEDQKQYVWYTPNKLICASTFNWDNHGSFLRVPTASFLRINAGTLWHERLSDFGDIIKNSLTATAPVPSMNYVRCKAMLNRLEFRCSGATPTKILIWIVSVSGSEALSGALTMPDIKTAPNGGINGLYAFRKRVLKEDLAYKFRILASKTVTLRPASLYTAGVTRLDGGAPDVPTVHTEHDNVVYLNEYFKGAGKRFQVDANDERAYREEVYLCMVADSVIDFTGVLQQKFRLEGPLQQAQPS